MTADASRLRGCAAFSFSTHAAVLGFYIALKLMEPHHKNLVLREVEYFDLKPVPAQEAGPPPAAQAPPRTLSDFIRMSIPRLKPSAPQEAQEAPKVPRDPLQFKALDRTPTLVGKSDPLERQATLKLDAKLERAAASSDLGEITKKADTRAIPQLSAIDAPKTISLDAVGRRAVAPSAPAIRIESSGGPARGMRDMPTAAPRGSPTGTALVAPAGLDLKEDQPVRRAAGGALPSGPSIGYGRGGGISLAERPTGRPASAALPAAPPPAAAKPAAEMVQAAASSRKGVEISGPLAGRKILTMVLPTYPDWARSKGVEAEVMIRFFVDPDGRVLDRMFIERTSGYKELDDISMEALKKIIFAPLDGAAKEEQWGVITFRFRLT